VLARPLVLSASDEATKDLEILALRQQLRVLRRQARRPRFTPLDRVLLAAASRAFPRQRWTSAFLVTLRRCCAGTANSCDAGGPAATSAHLAGHHWTLRWSHWCCGWGGRTRAGGCARICGELRRLGIRVGATPIRTLLRRHGLGPAPRRSGPSGRGSCEPKPSRSWPATSSRWRRSGSRRSTCCSSFSWAPEGSWQSGSPPTLTRRGLPAGQGCCDGPQRLGRIDQVPAPRPRRQVRLSFDDVFRSEGGRVLRTPIQAPKANARSLALAVPQPTAREQRPRQVNPYEVRRRDVLGGLIHEYYEVAAWESGLPRPTGRGQRLLLPSRVRCCSPTSATGHYLW